LVPSLAGIAAGGLFRARVLALEQPRPTAAAVR